METTRRRGDRDESTRVLVCTASGNFEGNFHHPPGVRLSDAIRNSFAADRHLLLTDVILQSDDPLNEPVSRAPFILINGAHANVIIPLEPAVAMENAAAASAPLSLVHRSVA